MKKHCNIPIFIPHMGCPHQCVFCNQRLISGEEAFSPDSVPRRIEEALATIPSGCEVEIAFFGGSFTGIERALMLELLETAESYVRRGCVQSIRLSTRPDYIDGEILSILSRYSVQSVELGFQSMSERVLQASGRGHTVRESEEAAHAVVASGFSLVGQMMIGLPGSTPEDELWTAHRIAELGAVAARIYPTVVFQGTPLCRMAEAGEYPPLSDETAVRRSAAVLREFLSRGVECLRIGLCASEHLSSPEEVWGGPNHPALGELVWNEYYYGELLRILDATAVAGDVELHVPRENISKVVGQHRRNLSRLWQERGVRVCRIVRDDTPNGTVAIVPCDPSENIRGGTPLCI